MGSKSSSPIGGYYPTSQNTSSNTTSSGTTTQSPDPLAATLYQSLLQNATGIASTPYQPYQGQMVAGMTPAQIAAMQGYQNAIGMATPYYTAAQDLYNQGLQYQTNTQLPVAAGYYSQGIQNANNLQLPQAINYYKEGTLTANNPMFGASQGLYNTSTQYMNNPLLSTAQNMYNNAINYSNLENYNQGNLSRYMNPYQQDVVDATMKQLAQTEMQAKGQNTQNAVLRGSYGGSGQFMGEAQIAQQRELANAQALASLNAQNYQNAQAQYNQQQAQAIAAQQTAATALGQFGHQQQALDIQALQNAAQGLGSLGYQNAALQTQALQNAAQGIGSLGYQNAALLAQAYQNAAQGLGSLGAQQQNAAIANLQGLASGMANLGTQQQQSYLQALGGLNTAGLQQQQLQQQQLNNAYQQWQQAQAFPYQQTSYLAGLASALGPLLGSTATTSGTSSSSGASLGMQPYANQQGAGGMAGAITSGLGLIGSLFGLKDGGRVTDRKHYAFGGTDDESEDNDPADEALGALMGSPYGSRNPSHQVQAAKSNFGSLAMQRPYSGGARDYITDSLKLSKIVPSARSVAADKLLGEISKVLGMAPEARAEAPSGITSSFFGAQDESGGSSGGDMFGSLGSLFKNATSSSETSSSPSSSSESGGFDLSSILSGNGESLFADGGRVSRDLGGTIGELMNSPESLAFNKQMNPTGNTGLGFEALLAQAKAAGPGPQKTPVEQGMPAMPPQSYYTKPIPGLAFNTNPFVPYPGTSGQSSGGSNKGVPAPYTRDLGLASSMGDSSNEDFISALYKNYLFRGPEEQGLKDWANKLGSGASRSDIENQFRSTTEASNDQFIQDLYNKILGRRPEEGAVGAWSNAMSSGMSARDVENAFLASPERESSAVVQGYYPTIESTTINPETGLFNLSYVAPYRSQKAPYGAGFAEGGSVDKASGGRLTFGDIARAALQAGATPKEAAMLTSIAMPESGRNPYAHNPNARTGDNSYGLWQINMLGGMGPERRRQFGLSSNEELYNPVTNAKAALQLLRGHGGLKNWTTYTSGKNRPYYSAAVDAVNNAIRDPQAMITKIEPPAPLRVASKEPTRTSIMYGPPPAKPAPTEFGEPKREEKPGLRLADLLDKMSTSDVDRELEPMRPAPVAFETAPIVPVRPIFPAINLMDNMAEHRGQYLDQLISANGMGAEEMA